MDDWRKRVDEALDMAETAKARGNEGMARVCARRAAGWAAQEYLNEKGIDLQTTSVIKHIDYLLRVYKVDPQVKLYLEHMLVAKQKDELESDSYFPLDVDLVAEAKLLISRLFPQSSS